MKTITIKKRGGGTRTVYVQSHRAKHHYRKLGHKLSELAKQAPSWQHMHGFTPGRSPVTQARAHVSFQYTLSMDIAEFFDHVCKSHLMDAGCPEDLAERALVDGATRQGLSSSPAAANLAGSRLDKDILDILPQGMVYTRYADDLNISGNNLAELLAVRDAIPALAARRGWRIKHSKTRLQSQRHGNRIICGVAVGETGIRATKAARRKLRAARHRHPGSNKTRGLEEWCALKPPKMAGGICAATYGAAMMKWK